MYCSNFSQIDISCDKPQEFWYIHNKHAAYVEVLIDEIDKFDDFDISPSYPSPAGRKKLKDELNDFLFTNSSTLYKDGVALTPPTCLYCTSDELEKYLLEHQPELKKEDFRIIGRKI